MPKLKRPLKVFISYAHEDYKKIKGLYDYLTHNGIDVWLDKENLLPGQDWELEIRNAVRDTDVVIVGLSKQFNQAGYRQKEVRWALDTADEQPDGEIFIIPARLDECELLSSLQKWHWVNLFEADGHEKLMKSLNRRAERLVRVSVNIPQLTELKPKLPPREKSISANKAESWLGYIFGPTFLFWAGGIGLFVWQTGWQAVLKDVQALALFQQVSWIVLALLALVFSSVLMRAIRFPILRLLEGVWPWPFNYLSLGIVAIQKPYFQKKYSELHRLASEDMKSFNAKQRKKLIQLDVWTHWHPTNPNDLLPTALGNILRARERSPERKYGLDWLVCWPRLHPLLPESMRTDLAKARSSLDRLVEFWFLGLLFLLWTFWTPWAAVIGLLWMIVTYGMAIRAAMAYGNLLESAFDLHRFLLYDEMGWPRPKNTKEEKMLGIQLTEYLWRGTLPEKLTYHSKEG